MPRPRRRGAELTLLACAVAVIAYGYAAVGYATSGALPADLATHIGGLAALALVAHVVVRLRAPCADPVLLPVALLLNGLGLVLVVARDMESRAVEALQRAGEKNVYRIGEVTAESGVEMRNLSAWS